MSAQNPDFTFESKQRIAKVVREVEGTPEDGTNVNRPTFPRGGTLPHGEFYGMVYGNVTDRRGGFFYLPIVSVPPGF